jgi:hypothetical protein
MPEFTAGFLRANKNTHIIAYFSGYVGTFLLKQTRHVQKHHAYGDENADDAPNEFHSFFIFFAEERHMAYNSIVHP